MTPPPIRADVVEVDAQVLVELPDEPQIQLVVEPFTPRGLLLLFTARPQTGLVTPLAVVRTDDEGMARVLAAFGLGARAILGNAAAIDWFKERAKAGGLR